MQVQSCCFASQTYCFFDVLVAVAVVVAKAPYASCDNAASVSGFTVNKTLKH